MTSSTPSYDIPSLLLLCFSLPILILSSHPSLPHTLSLINTAIFKILSSASFLLTAHYTSASTLLLYSLYLGFTGDVLLLSTKERDFMLGMAAFAGGHIGYIWGIIRMKMNNTNTDINPTLLNGVMFIFISWLCYRLGSVVGIPYISYPIHTKLKTTQNPNSNKTFVPEKDWNLSRQQTKYQSLNLETTNIQSTSSQIFSTPTAARSPCSLINDNNNNHHLEQPQSSNTKTTSVHQSQLQLIIPPPMQPLVFIYFTIITTMLALSCSTLTLIPNSTSTSAHHSTYTKPTKTFDTLHSSIHLSNSQITIGAILFAISDLCVAIDVFGVERNETSRWKVRSIGWVLYFVAQNLLAGSGL